MENTDIIEKIAHLEERDKSNTKRIDEHDEKIEKLENTYSMLEKMDYRMGKVETSVENINNKLDTKINEDSKSKGQKWDKLIEYIFYAVLGTLLSYIAVKIGIK